MFLDFSDVRFFLIGDFDIIIVFVFQSLLFFDFVMVDSGSLIESLQYFGQLFLLGVSEFFILDELLKLFDEELFDLLGVLEFSEKVEEKVDIEAAFSFVGEGLEHG